MADHGIEVKDVRTVCGYLIDADTPSDAIAARVDDVFADPIIEHQLDVVKSCDWVIDLGPEGGERGGQIIATGTPEAVAANENSPTGHFLAKMLNN